MKKSSYCNNEKDYLMRNTANSFGAKGLKGAHMVEQ
jgi:hypothetical protein